MIIRKSTLKDVEQIEKIYAHAKEFMRANGNPNQWKGDYPNAFDAEEDVKNGIGYVCESDGEIVGVFAFNIAVEPTYNTIYNGAWQNDSPYAFMHRIAVSNHGKGVVDFCIDYCFKLYSNLKIDTHRDNIPMQKCLARHGFEYCGIIHLLSGDERMAYQKIS